MNVSATELIEDATQMTDLQLRDELRTRGVEAGPITPSTRPAYEKKLQRLLGQIAGQELGDDNERGQSGDEEDANNDEAEKRCRPSEEALAEELLPCSGFYQEETSTTASVAKKCAGGALVTESMAMLASSRKRVTLDFGGTPPMEGMDYSHEEFGRDITPKSRQKRLAPSSQVPTPARRPMLKAAAAAKTRAIHPVEKRSTWVSRSREMLTSKWLLISFALLLLGIYVRFLRR